MNKKERITSNSKKVKKVTFQKEPLSSDTSTSKKANRSKKMWSIIRKKPCVKNYFKESFKDSRES
jgi:hypothetical protein